MWLKKYLFSLLIVFLAFTTGCTQNVLLDEHNSKLLNYNFRIANLKNIDKTLSKQRYSYSTNIDKECVAVIIYKSKNAAMKQYYVDDYGGNVDITVPKDSKFIISLHESCTITYTWGITNNIDNGVIKLKNRSWIEIPMPKSERGKCGENFNRQNFYFEPLKSGSEKIVMRYEHETLSEQPYKEITFNIIH